MNPSAPFGNLYLYIYYITTRRTILTHHIYYFIYLVGLMEVDFHSFIDLKLSNDLINRI